MKKLIALTLGSIAIGAGAALLVEKVAVYSINIEDHKLEIEVSNKGHIRFVTNEEVICKMMRNLEMKESKKLLMEIHLLVTVSKRNPHEALCEDGTWGDKVKFFKWLSAQTGENIIPL